MSPPRRDRLHEVQPSPALARSLGSARVRGSLRAAIVNLDPDQLASHQDDDPEESAVTRCSVQDGIRRNLASQQDRVICCRVPAKDTADELPCPRHLVTRSPGSRASRDAPPSPLGSRCSLARARARARARQARHLSPAQQRSLSSSTGRRFFPAHPDKLPAATPARRAGIIAADGRFGSLALGRRRLGDSLRHDPMLRKRRVTSLDASKTPRCAMSHLVSSTRRTALR